MIRYSNRKREEKREPAGRQSNQYSKVVVGLTLPSRRGRGLTLKPQARLFLASHTLSPSAVKRPERDQNSSIQFRVTCCLHVPGTTISSFDTALIQQSTTSMSNTSRIRHLQQPPSTKHMYPSTLPTASTSHPRHAPSAGRVRLSLVSRAVGRLSLLHQREKRSACVGMMPVQIGGGRRRSAERCAESRVREKSLGPACCIKCSPELDGDRRALVLEILLVSSRGNSDTCMM